MLALNQRRDGPDQRCVVLIWSGTHSAWLADPNDEGISWHRLYRRQRSGCNIRICCRSEVLGMRFARAPARRRQGALAAPLPVVGVRRRSDAVPI
jgi:hypothetical protein